MTTKSLNIIMLPLARWDGPYSSTAFSLALELSKRHNVFYLDNPFTYKDVLKNIGSPQMKKRRKAFFRRKMRYFKVQNAPDGFTAVFTDPVLPINFLPSGALYNQLLRHNDSKIASVIDHIVKDYGIDEYVFINSFNPFYGHKFNKHKPALSIYQSVDNIAESKYVSKHGVALEFNAAAKADLVLTTSMALTKKFEQKGCAQVVYLPNAANVELFKRAAEDFVKATDLETEGKKIIGYFGNICHRLDYNLLKFLAEKHSDKLIYLVGPVSGKEFNESGLREFINIRTTGKKSLEELPPYLNCFDVAIIPFKVNELTSCIYPLKVNEYLAGGKPVVSTVFSEDIKTFSEIVYLAEDIEEFSRKITLALQQNSQEKIIERVIFAEKNSWQARALELEKTINDELQKKASSFPQQSAKKS